ncbi:hypothetical protein SCUCBS95973_009460 [Sporothrix curviconia]|uniref:C2H2-type domain-containing protein n=1 Tax=Sporothrix curviconia TaxID=1260050 RepID=A0ABP0CV69_9PEZI
MARHNAVAPASEPRTPSRRRNGSEEKSREYWSLYTNALSCTLCHKVYSRSDVLSHHLVQAHGQRAKRAGRPRKSSRSVNEAAAANSPHHSPRHVLRSSGREVLRRSAQTPSRAVSVSVYTAGDDIAHNDDTPQNEAALPTNNAELVAVVAGPTPVRIEWDMLSHELGSLGSSNAVPVDNQNQNQQQQQQQLHNSQHQCGFEFDDSLQNLYHFSTSEDYGWTANDAPAAGPLTASFDWGFTDVPDTTMFEAIGALPPPPPLLPLPPAAQDVEPHLVTDASPALSSGASGYSASGRKPPDRDSEIVRALKAEEVNGQPNTGDLPNGSPEESAWPTVYYQSNTPVDPVDLPTVTRPSTPTSRAPVAAISSISVGSSSTAAAGARGGSVMTASASINTQARMSMQILAAYAHRPVWPLPDLANLPSIPSLTACVNCYLTHFAAWLPIVDSPHRSFRVVKAAPVLLMAMAAIGAVYASGGLEKPAFPIDELVRRQIVYIPDDESIFCTQTIRQPKNCGAEIPLPQGTHIQVSLPVLAVTPGAVEPGSPSALTEPRPTFSQMMASLLDDGQLLEEPSDMGLSCLAYSLYRLCLEAASAPLFLRKQQQQSHTATAQTRLDQLARHVIDTPASLPSLRLSCVALAHHAYLELTDPGLLSMIKVAAGRSGEQEQQAAQGDVARKLQMDAVGARCLFAHAAMLQCLLNRFTFDTPTEVIWTFDAALAMWAVLRFSGQSLEGPHQHQSGGAPPVYNHHVLLTWKPSPFLDDWVRSIRGRLSVQGIGNNDGGALTAASVLKGASKRLEVMSWGLAAKYRVVLKGMLAKM